MLIRNPSKRDIAILLLIFILINIVLLSSVRLLPFIDLPNHLAEATIYKFYAPGNLFADYYKPTPWYFPNTFHTIFCSLFPSVEVGNKIFHILYIVLLQLSVFLVIMELRGNPWYGLLAILFTYNYNVTFGFVGFAISIPLLILLFYAILRYIRQERLYLNVIIAFLLVMLFYMHAQNALMGLVVYGCMMLYHYRSSLHKFFYHVVLIPLPLLVIIVAWWSSRSPEQEEQSTIAYLLQYYRTDYFETIGMRFRIAVLDNFQLREGWAGLMIAGCFFLCVLIPVIAVHPWKWQSSSIIRSSDFVYASIFLLIILVCYLFAPDKLPGQTPIFQRFCTVLILSFIIAASVFLRDARLPWLPRFVLAVVVVYTALWGEYLYRFNVENKSFRPQFFAEMTPHKKLVGLIYANEYRGRNVYIHFPNYYIVWQKGIAASKIIDYRFGVVRRVASEGELPFYEELIADNYRHQPAYQQVDYLLVRGVAPVAPDANLSNFALWREAGAWSLFKKEKK